MTSFHVSRNGTKLGVYPENDAVDYFSQGRIGPNDPVWREGMAAWRPASEVFGATGAAAAPAADFAQPELAGSPAPQPSLPPPLPPPPPAPPSPPPTAPPPAPPQPSATVETSVREAQPTAPARAAIPTGPRPPRMHWALVLLLTLATLGLFFIVWMFVQAFWVRRIDPTSKATWVLAIYVALVLIGQVLVESGGKGSSDAVMGTLLVLAGSVVSVIGFFSMRRSMLQHFNQIRPGSLKLSAALTLFLNVFYFQYHLTRLADEAPPDTGPWR